MTQLELAQCFEDALSHLWDANRMRQPKTFWLSCYAIGMISNDARMLVVRSLLSQGEFSLGMEDDFDAKPDPTNQYARALWLTLCAELAERGDLTMEGLR